MISPSPETIELCKQLEPSFWTLAKPYLAESIVYILGFSAFFFLILLFLAASIYGGGE